MIQRSYAKTILNAHVPGDVLCDVELKEISEMLTHHPEAPDKIGTGIAMIRVQQNPRFPNKYFQIERTDGSVMDFSYIACYAKPETDLARIKRVFRSVILDQILSCKTKTFTGIQVIPCPITGELISFTTCHIDHQAPQTFDRIVMDFIQEKNLDVSHIEYEHESGESYVDVLKDKQLEQDFSQYHKDHAVLRAVSKKANLSLLRKG